MHECGCLVPSVSPSLPPPPPHVSFYPPLFLAPLPPLPSPLPLKPILPISYLPSITLTQCIEAGVPYMPRDGLYLLS